jgi:aryl-alcohol dehydrogenase-like predicted oxidoreductase
MDTVQFGNSGLRVSEICLGTMTFSREADKDTSFAIMDYYREHGGFFLDTANVYSAGASEETVGAWIAERGVRDNVVLATKVYGSMGPEPNDGGLSRHHIVAAVERSLSRLKTDHIDLYQIHRWSPLAPVEETARALDDLVRSGKVRYIGCSNLRAYQLLSYLHHQRDHSLSPFISIQPAYNALNRAMELEVFPLVEREGLAVICYNPLAGGMLTGKYRKGEALPDGVRMQKDDYYFRRYHTDQALDVTERFVAHAKELSLTPAQLAMNWVRADTRITCPIVGARSVEQLADSLGALDRSLSPEERDAVPAVPSGRWVGEDPVYDRTPYRR